MGRGWPGVLRNVASVLGPTAGAQAGE
jgi:hypothetical protein